MKGDDGYITGETGKETDLKDGDLTLSLGYWAITINGYDSKDKLVYTGSLKADAITADSKVTVDVKPEAGMVKVYTDLATAAKATGENETVTLLKDIDLEDKEWTPIGAGKRSKKTYDTTGCTPFKGTFDGDGHTISNLKISSPTTEQGEDYALGLFGVVDGGTIKNLILKDVNIDASNSSNETNKKASKCLGAVAGLMVNGAKLSNVRIESGTIKAGQAGGLVGRMTVNGTIENCVNKATVEVNASGAGIVSKAYYSEKNEDGSLKGGINIINCRNEGKITAKSGGYTAGIVGLLAGNAIDCVNTADISSTNNNTAGIVGQLTNYGKVSGCDNSGNITSTGSNPFGVGGIVGWVIYQTGDENYGYTAAVEIVKNTNTGNIDGGSTKGVGGIVGMVYNTAKVNNNINKATSIKGGEFVSGIVGGHQVSSNNTLNTDDVKATEIKDNTSETAEANITGSGCMSTIVYINDGRVTKVSGNSPENKNITKQ